MKSVLSRINDRDWKAWRKKYLIVDDCMLDKVIRKIKEAIDIKILMIIKYWLKQMINCSMILL